MCRSVCAFSAAKHNEIRRIDPFLFYKNLWVGKSYETAVEDPILPAEMGEGEGMSFSTPGNGRFAERVTAVFSTFGEGDKDNEN